jgi:hypothetical protein
MSRPDQILGFVVSVMFLVGAILFIYRMRVRAKNRQQWDGDSRSR